MASRAEMQGRPLVLKRLLACGIAAIDDNALRALGKVTPFLEVLDLSYTRLHNSALDAFVTCDVDQHHKHPTILLTAAQAGRSSGTQDFYRRRLTKLRHLNLSACTLLTDSACTSLAYTMPDLECLELANIGTSVKDDGVIRLFRTTPALKKLDLEGASSIGDAVVVALTPPLVDIEDDLVAIPQLGSALEHLSLSHVNRVTSEVLSALILACARLRVLEIDETRISGRVMKDFVRLSRERKILSSKLVAVDCRGVSEALVKQLANEVRPRMGWRAWEARGLGFVDGRDALDDDTGLAGGVGVDECDEERVVLKSFYSWQGVDAVSEARRARAISSSSSSAASSRWWSRRSSGTNSPAGTPAEGDREGCVVM